MCPNRRTQSAMVRAKQFAFYADIFCILVPIAVAIAIAATAVEVPYWDEWEWVDLIFKFHTGTLHFGDLWAQHNEHRVFFPQLLMLGLDWLGGWSQLREQLMSIVVLVAGEIAFLWSIRRSSRGLVAAVASIGGTAFLFGLWQVENYTWGFQTAWFMCSAAAIAVAAILGRPHRSTAQVLGAALIAIVASYSLAQGLAVWAVGAVAIVCAPRNAVVTLILWLLGAAATYAYYVHGLGPSVIGHVSLKDEVGVAIQFTLAYLGSTVGGGSRDVAVCAVFGAIGLGLLVASLVADLVRPERLRHFVRRAPFYALAVFPMLTALATAKGRAGLGMFQALDSRYTTVNELFWMALIGIGATFLTRRRLPGPVPIATAAAAAAVLVGLLMWSDRDGWHAWKIREDGFAASRSALERGDVNGLSEMYPDPIRLRRLLGELQSVHDGLYAR